MSILPVNQPSTICLTFPAEENSYLERKTTEILVHAYLYPPNLTDATSLLYKVPKYVLKKRQSV